MTLQELINNFREVADDKSSLPLWSDALLTFYANEAQTEAARRARLFKDSSTAEVCAYAVAAGDQTIELDSRVLFPKIVKIDSKALPLLRVHQADIDRIFPGWDAVGVANGDPTHYVPDKDTGLLWFNAPFSDSDTVRIACYREPLVPMVLGTAPVGPEVRGRHQYGLINWMMYRALNMRDVEEKYDPKAAEGYEAMFEAEFGKRSSAIDETWIEREQMYDDHDGTF
jgi:hypothetical protein